MTVIFLRIIMRLFLDYSRSNGGLDNMPKGSIIHGCAAVNGAVWCAECDAEYRDQRFPNKFQYFFFMWRACTLGRSNGILCSLFDCSFLAEPPGK
ncbi:hypothetical protein SAMN06298226_2396 [Nitrosovibrio sp. Nv4]|nr:hypothetical protein SAMN06298226_2396 [Nitrosovibrio sp. Nv4]